MHDAIFTPTYNSNIFANIFGVVQATFQKGTRENGLLRDEWNKKHYDTVYAYSGSTRTAITALLHQGVTCDSLVLISPIKGPIPDPLYENEIKQLLESGIVKHITIYQSAADRLSGDLLYPLMRTELNAYQYKFPAVSDDRIEVINVPFKKGGLIKGEKVHEELLSIAFDHINGIAIPTEEELEQRISTTISSESIFGELGGVNFTSINLNYISSNPDQIEGPSLDYVLKAEKAEGTEMGVDVINSTEIATTAFMTGLAMPGYRFWVNLNPWEPKRLLDDRLGETDVGRIMLEADLQMKKDFSNYENPCANETGEEFWALLVEKQKSLVRECMEKYPGELRNERNVSFMAVTRFWIVPKTAYAYYNGTSISIINSSLTILSDPIPEYATYILDNPSISLSNDCREELNKSAIEYSRYARELEDSMILPYVVYDVNHAERYSDLRSVYTSLALAQGYKEKIDPKTDALRDSIDSLNVSALKSMTLWSPEEIWERYAYSFSNKEYKCWQNKTINTTYVTQDNEQIPGTFIESQLIASGGVDFSNLKDNLTFINGIPQDVQTRVDKAISEGYVEEGKDVLFGAKIPVDMINDAIGAGSSPGSGPRPPSNLTSYDSMEVHGHGGDNSTKDQGAYYVCGPCPDGWSGPDENCLCSKWVEVTS